MTPGIEVAGPARRINVPSTFNLRDVGGYPVGDDRMTAWGRLYRSDLPGPSAEVAALGLRTVIDLRSERERSARPSVATSLDGVRALHHSFGVGELLAADPSIGASLSSLYAAVLEHQAAAVAAAVSALLEPDALPALVHCTAGKDRTGLVIALVLSSVGVDDEVVAADYAVTADLLTPEFFAGVDRTHVVPEGEFDPTPLYGADAASMRQTLDAVRDLYGGAQDYLVRHGVSRDGLLRLSDELVVPL